MNCMALELVWVRCKARKRSVCLKLQRRFKGPYKVIERIMEVLYRVVQVQVGGLMWLCISTDSNLFFLLHQKPPTKADVREGSKQIPHNLKQVEVLAESIGKPLALWGLHIQGW